jgi:hypothetical protein
MTISATSLSAPVSPLGTLLPISGWRLSQRLLPNGRVAIEINDDTGDLVGLITSTNLPMLSVDGAWRGTADAGGTRRWWALAIGHATTSDDDPAVTFTRRLGPYGIPHRTMVRPALMAGLWIAAVPGLHTTVTCRQGTEHRIRRLGAAPRWHSAL